MIARSISLIFALGLSAGVAAAQSGGVQVVSARVEGACGMCSGKYAERAIEVDSNRVTEILIDRSDEDTVRHKPKKIAHRISKADWDELRQSIDSATVASLVGRIGCPGCIDLPIHYVLVRFSDGTTRFVEYDDGAKGSVAVQRLIQRIEALAALRLDTRGLD